MARPGDIPSAGHHQRDGRSEDEPDQDADQHRYLVEVELAPGRSLVREDGPSRLGVATAELEHLLVGPVRQVDAGLLELATDVDRRLTGVDRPTRLGQRGADDRSVGGLRPLSSVSSSQARSARASIRSRSRTSRGSLFLPFRDSFSWSVTLIAGCPP
jgi:hypothetical protein